MFNTTGKVFATWLLAAALAAPVAAQQQTLAWGDQGNGTYVNPILNTDLSDPDVIRVGEKYYMVASDFHFIGMQLLESSDLVNWHIVTQVYDRFDLPGWDANKHYAGGSWAPALRYHDGKFWIYFCTPDEGLFMTQAEKPEGPWTPLHCVKAVSKWEDPCPFWDDDGQAYLGRSQWGAGPIILHRMSVDGRTLLDDGVTVYTGPVAEGTKLLKRNGYYYLSIPEGGVGTGWQTVLRARSIYGPYEKKVVLEQGSTDVNGPHQGAMVDTPEGQWWFFHFQHNGALGRVVHLQPMHWSNDWPVVGVDIDRNGIGEPVRVWQTPVVGGKDESGERKEEDGFSFRSQRFTFNSPRLNPVWQWNHNPADDAWSLTEHKGRLTLHGLKAADFKSARNTLTQRVVGYQSEATVCIDCSHMDEDGCAGLACMGKTNQLLDVKKGDGKVFLRISFDMPSKQYRFWRSKDNKHFTPVGQPFFVDFGHWKGVRFAIYHYNTLRDAGYINVEWVEYNIF
jgi:beta-xylosidase